MSELCQTLDQSLSLGAFGEEVSGRPPACPRIVGTYLTYE